jgi:hypothetical protein
VREHGDDVVVILIRSHSDLTVGRKTGISPTAGARQAEGGGLLRSPEITERG